MTAFFQFHRATLKQDTHFSESPSPNQLAQKFVMEYSLRKESHRIYLALLLERYYQTISVSCTHALQVL